MIKGFTLIEVIVTVAIVGILAAVAYPAYQSHVVKTRRKAAEACLLELAQFMERYYTTNMSYARATLPSTQCRAELGGHYTFGFEGAPTAASFKIKAMAQGIQAAKDASCASLSVTHTGAKSPSECW